MMNSLAVSCATLCLTVVALSQGAAQPDFRVPLGERQLFLDDYAIASMEGLTRTMHQPMKRGAVIRPPVGQAVIQVRSAPCWDSQAKLFRYWDLSGPPEVGPASGYYESPDGLQWSRVNLRQVQWRGSWDTNYVSVQVGGRQQRIDCSVYDPTDPDPSRRYKGLSYGAGGVTWKALDVPPIPSWDEFNFSFDEKAHLFIATVKTGGPYGRSHALSTSTDFEHWTAPELIFHADELDQELGRRNIEACYADPRRYHPWINHPDEYNVDVYNFGVFRYEGLYVGMPAMFHHTGKYPKEWPGFADMVMTPQAREVVNQIGDYVGFHIVQLACSRDLHNWTRLGDRGPFIEPSPLGAGAYDTATIMPPSTAIVRDDELWFYYTGITHYDCVTIGQQDHIGAVCLAILRRDGFMSLDAGEQPGVLTTKPFALEGKRLFVNVDAPAGSLQVEALDLQGTVLATSVPLTGDQPHGEVKWQQGDLAALQGQTVALRFTLTKGRLFSFWAEA
jgi:hypothetical protein